MAHAAFPSLPPPPSSSSLAPAPCHPSQIRDLITSYTSLPDIQHLLIPLLQSVAEGNGQVGSKVSQKVKHGEEILGLHGVDVGSSTNEALGGMTAGMIYVVSARLNKNFPAYHDLDTFNLAVRLCNVADPQQLHLCRGRVGDLAWGLLRLAQQLKQTSSVLQPLLNLTHLLPRGILSGAQAVFLEVCLLEREYEAAIPLIRDIYLDVHSARPTYLDILTFHHHAGLVCAATKDYSRAIELFTVAITAPTHTASAIQVACAKRAILCELLVSGKLIRFPKYTSHAVTRAIERGGSEYAKLNRAFESGDCEDHAMYSVGRSNDRGTSAYFKLARAFEAGNWEVVKAAEKDKVFADDCNVGLLNQVLYAVTKRRIQRLQATYSRLTVVDLASKVGLGDDVDQVTVMLEEMIASSAIFASISHSSTPSSAIVTFHDENLAIYTSPPSLLGDIKQADAMASWLEQELTRANRFVGISEAYLGKQVDRNQVVKGGPSLDWLPEPYDNWAVPA